MPSVSYLHYNVLLLKIARQYRLHNPTILWKIIHYSVRLFCYLFLLLFLVGFIMDLKTKGPFKFNATALTYGFMSATLTVVQRVIYYYSFDYKTEKLVLRMNEFFVYETSTGLEEKNMKSCINVSNRLTFGWVIYGQVAWLAFCLIPLGYVNEHHRFLPMPMWFPYDWKISPKYEITYFFQGCLTLVMALLHSTTDMFFAALILLTSKQFDLLGWEFKNLIYSCLLDNGVPKGKVSKFREQFNGYKSDSMADIKTVDFSQIYMVCESQEFNNSMSRRMNKLIQFHQELLSFCADLEDFFSPLMLAFYIIIMSAALFLNFAVVMSRNLSLVYSCLPLCLAAYLEVFFPCFMANILLTEAQKLQTDLYELPWYICNKECKINVKYLLHKMQMPARLTVGKFSNLDLTLFLWTMQTLNSYSIVLYQLTE